MYAQGNGFAVHVPVLGIALGLGVVKLIGQGIGGDGVAVAGEDVGDGIAALVIDGDMIGHGEIRLLAHGLDLADQLPDEAFFNEGRGQTDIQHHGGIPVGLRHKAFLLAGGYQHILGGEADGRALQLEGIGIACLVGGYHLVAHAALGQVGVDLRQQLAIAGPKGLELGLHVVGDEGGSVVDIFHGLHVQLLGDDGGIQRRQGRALDKHGGQGLPVFDVGGIAGAAAQHHHIQHLVHVGFQLGIDEALVHSGPIAQVDALRGVLVHGTDDVLVDLLSHEGDKGGGDQAQGLEDGKEGHISSLFIRGHILAPVAVAAAAHIPVGQVVDKPLELPAGLGDADIPQVGVHSLDQGIEPGEDPLIHGGKVFPAEGMGGGIKAVDVRIEDIEGIGVPESTHEFPLGFGYGFRGEAAGQPGHGAGIEIPTHRVGSLLIQYGPGIHHVALVLAHLQAVLILDQAQHQAILEAGLVEQAGGDGQEGIEPAPGLVHGLADEVGGVAAGKELLVFKGIVPLGKGHGTAIEPAVDHHGFPAHFAAALLAGEGDGIQEGLVELQVLRGAGGQLAQFLPAADHMDVAAILAHPYGQGGAPIALPADAPIDDVFQEVAHAAFLDGLGDPVDAPVVFHEPVPDGGHLDEPALAGVIDQGGVAAPAEGIAMLKLRRRKQQARFF